MTLRTTFCSFLYLLRVATCAAPTALTTGSGNDTEAAWSPDGKQVMFQSDRSGTLDLYLLDESTGRVEPIVQGPGHACFPAWSPDGKWIVYSYAHFTKTAFEAKQTGGQDGYNLFIVPAVGGEPRRLTSGQHRDYCATFSRDGKTIYFSSTRGNDGRYASVSILTIPTTGGEPKTLLKCDQRDRAAVQATFSPDGRVMAYGHVAGYRGQWGIWLARADAPTDSIALTAPDVPFYGPRWHPTKALLACTGSRRGDRGWQVYLVCLRTGQLQRVSVGPGNSRSPAWSPDGKWLVFEDNRTGSYKLYRLPAPEFAPEAEQALPSAQSPAELVLHYDFVQRQDKVLKDLSPMGNDGQVAGNVLWRDGAASFTNKGAYITIAKAKGLDFEAGPFSVQATVEATARGEDLGFICMGEYPGNRLGWQLFVGKKLGVRFNSRNTELLYRGTHSTAPLPLGRTVTMLGVRDASGFVKLYLDGARQPYAPGDAFYSYGEPKQVRIGTQYDGTRPFQGWIHEIKVYRGEVSAEGSLRQALARFWSE